MDRREPLLFYCQHSLGMGHLVRSLALAASLAERFRVVLLNGGKLPARLTVPRGVEVVNLPPLGLDSDGRLVSRDRRRTAARAKELRRALVVETYRVLRPASYSSSCSRSGARSSPTSCCRSSKRRARKRSPAPHHLQPARHPRRQARRAAEARRARRRDSEPILRRGARPLRPRLRATRRVTRLLPSTNCARPLHRLRPPAA